MRTDAWLLQGLTRSWPGQLRLSGRRLSFLGADGRCVFSEPLDRVQVRFPWFYFSGGLVVQTPDARHRISFGAPAQAQRSKSLRAAVGEIRNIVHMRRIGRLWMRTLADLH